MKKKPFDRAAHCRRIASKGGKALVKKHGKEHMSAIGRKGYVVTVSRYFLGDDRLHRQWLLKAGLYAYWQSTGLPMKYTADGVPLWPEAAPVHPAHTTAPGQRGLFEKGVLAQWQTIPF